MQKYLHRVFAVLVLSLALASCAASADTSYLNDTDPCHDSLYVALQNKPYVQLTAYEQAYFNQKYNECNGNESHSSSAETLTAVLLLVAAVFELLSVMY